jgi:osmoprotectant transport system substrate-binding protein
MILAATGCSSTTENPDTEINELPTIQVGSKDFTESYILGELFALAIEDLGYPVERKFNLGNFPVIIPAMKKGEIDIYPEYTGTLLLNYLNHDLITDPAEVYNIASKALAENDNLIMLNAAEASNSQGFAILTEMSEKFGITNISELQANAGEIRFASHPSFDENADSRPLLESTYGLFEFKSAEYYDNALKYQLAKQGEVDLVIAFTTDGNLVDSIFTVLDDDMKIWPPYNIVPVVRGETYDAYPDITEAINKLTATLDNKTMQQLNAKVDIDKLEPEEVAKEYFEANK